MRRFSFTLVLTTASLLSIPAFASKDVRQTCRVNAGILTEIASGTVSSVKAEQTAQRAKKKKDRGPIVTRGHDLATRNLPEVRITDVKVSMDFSRKSVFGDSMRSRNVATGKISLVGSRQDPIEFRIDELGRGGDGEDFVLSTGDGRTLKVRVELSCEYSQI